MSRLMKPSILMRLILGGIFIYAGLDKIINPVDFADAIYNYQILPAWLIHISAIVLPWLEFLLGLLLVAGRWMPGAASLCNLLLVVFFGALLYNMARGLDVHCGCFSTQPTGDPTTWWYVIRDTFLLIMSITLLFHVIYQEKQEK